jgi:hypothetical protein
MKFIIKIKSLANIKSSNSKNLTFKIAKSNKSILEKRILIPSDVKKNAEEAYKKRFDEIRFGDHKTYELARQLFQRTYLEIEEILKIHEYTVKNRYIRSKSKKQPSYWEYMLHGGDEGRKWASDIIKIYLPKKWKTN